MIENNEFIPFIEKYDYELYEHIEQIKISLQKTNEEYIKMQEEVDKIIDNSKGIQQIICNDKIERELSIEESKQFAKLISIYNCMQQIVEKEIYFKGGTDAYHYFKKINIIK